jgi:hypothetical protein
MSHFSKLKTTSNMKKIFLASAAAVCFLISCKDEKSTTTASTETTSQTYMDKNAAFMKSIESGDFSTSKDWLAADAVDHGGAPDGGDVKGADSIIANLKMVNKCFEPGFKMNIIKQAVDGDYLFVLSEMTGKTTVNPGMGMPPSTQMDMKAVDVITIKDGKAYEHWSFANTADMMKMMGGPGGHPDHMMPPPPAGGDKMQADTMKK